MLSRFPASSAVALSCLLAACSQSTDVLDSVTTSSIAPSAYAQTPRDRECMARAMFFESIRSSREGLVAVGTVVMNRVNSDEFPDTVCEVVAQKNQFAPGVMTREMNSGALPDVVAAADDVLAGERHPAVHSAKFFHQAGLRFPYNNMHYVLEAGGNEFYEKRSRKRQIVEAATPKQGAAEDDGTALSFVAEQTAANAIGALIMSQQRPERPE